MKSAKWKIVATFLLVIGVVTGVQSAMAGPVVGGAGGVPPVSGGGGSGGGGSSLPVNWSISSWSGRSEDWSSAGGNVSSETMGIPDQVFSNINWYYRDGAMSSNGKPNLFFTIGFYTSGDLERPDEALSLTTGGRLNLNSVTVQEFDDGWLFQFENQLAIEWNGGYSSWLFTDEDGKSYVSGSFSGEASVSPGGANLAASPQLSFNVWDDPIEPEPSWFKDYDASVLIFGSIPSESYTATVVPEPATATMLGIAAAIALLRRPRRHHLELEQNKIG